MLELTTTLSQWTYIVSYFIMGQDGLWIGNAGGQNHAVPEDLYSSLGTGLLLAIFEAVSIMKRGII